MERPEEEEHSPDPPPRARKALRKPPSSATDSSEQKQDTRYGGSVQTVTECLIRSASLPGRVRIAMHAAMNLPKNACDPS
eukprot:34596-Prorocentrum_minimum.AAC.2